MWRASGSPVDSASLMQKINKRRPSGGDSSPLFGTSITFVSWVLILLNGLGLLVLPVYGFMVWSHNEEMIRRGFRCDNEVFPWFLLLSGVLVNMMCGIGLLQDKNIARFIYVIWNGIFFMVVAIESIVLSRQSEVLGRIPGLVVFGIITAILFNRRANNYFKETDASHMGMRDYFTLVCIASASIMVALAAVLSPLPEWYVPEALRGHGRF